MPNDNKSRKSPAPNVWEDVPSSEWEDVSNFNPDQLSLPGGTPRLVQAATIAQLPSAMPTAFEQKRDPNNQPGLWGTVSDKLSSLGNSAQAFAKQWQDESNAPQPRTKEEMWARNEKFRDSTERMPMDVGLAMKGQAQRPLPPDLAGNPLYRGATTLSPLVPLLNPEASEKASDVGDRGAVAAEAAIPAAAALIPAAGKYAYERGVVGTRPARAANAYQRGVLPQTMKAADRTEAVSHFERASPYLGQQERALPVGKGADVWTDSAQAAEVAGQQLWQQSVQPAIRAYGDKMVHGDAVAARIASEFSPLDRVVRSGAVDTADSLADYYNRPMSLQQVSDELTQLNNDKAVRSYYRMSDEARAAADLDPSSAPLRSKLAAQNGLRDLLFDSLGEHMAPEDAARFQEARRAFGSLKEVERRYAGASTPAPTNWLERGVNTLRAPSVSGAYESWLKNPQRQAGRSMSLLGSADPQMSPTMQVPQAPNLDLARHDPQTYRVDAPQLPAPAPGAPQRSSVVYGNETPRPMGPVPPGAANVAPGFPGAPDTPPHPLTTMPPYSPSAPFAPPGEGARPTINSAGVLPPMGHPVAADDPMWSGTARPGIVPTRGPAATPEGGSMTTPGWPGTQFQGPTNTPSPLWDRLPASARESMFRGRPQPAGVTFSDEEVPPAQQNLSLPGGTPPTPATPVIGNADEGPNSFRTGLPLPERRGSLRDITGPDPMRTALMNQLRKRIEQGDPLAQQQLDDILAHPFERHEGGDIRTMKAQRRLSRKDAEANTEKRAQGRKQRFAAEQ